MSISINLYIYFGQLDKITDVGFCVIKYNWHDSYLVIQNYYLFIFRQKI